MAYKQTYELQRIYMGWFMMDMVPVYEGKTKFGIIVSVEKDSTMAADSEMCVYSLY